MGLPIETLEAFFGEKFRFEQRVGQLTHFDGYLYWHLLWMPESGQFLKIIADRDHKVAAFPTVEVEGCYSDDLSVSPLSSGGVALVLQPECANEPKNHVVITKTKNGRLSLSTTVGTLQPAAQRITAANAGKASEC
jgi:hypothetical protein